MRLATIKASEKEIAVVITEAGLAPMNLINVRYGKNWADNIYDIISSGQFSEIKDWYHSAGKKALLNDSNGLLPNADTPFAPLYRQARKIWGIGLNYKAQLEFLGKDTPRIPASFMKPDSTIIGCMDDIRIPLQSQWTTGEAELGIVIGKTCRDVKKEDWLSVVAGFTSTLDMTAEDILREFGAGALERHKSYDTFFSFGPELVTPDEIEDIDRLVVQTVHNGEVVGENSPSNMIFSLGFLVEYLSQINTFFPGDIITTGTPRAVTIKHGDVIESRISGFEPLVNPVIDLKTT